MKLRKTLSVAVATVAVAIIGTVTASAETFGDYEYTVLDDGTVEITDYTGEDTTLEILSEIDGKAVTSIGELAFADCDSLTSVTIPKSVTSIGESAFQCSDSITTIKISKSVTNIDNFAFLCCIGLENIIVDENNEHFSAEDGVLFNKDKTKLVQYPIGSNKTAYTIPDSVTTIGNSAFSLAETLTNVTIPDSVISLEEDAFYNCSSLTSITIPDSVTSIGTRAFGFIYDDSIQDYVPKEGVTIKCSQNSAAHTYAKEFNINCEIVNESENPDTGVVVSFAGVALAAAAVVATKKRK